MRLRCSGSRKRFTYSLAGVCAGVLAAWGLGALFGKPIGIDVFGIALGCGSVANAIAGQAEKVDKDDRLITVFPRKPRDCDKP
jgi:hypothetical protein